MSTRNYLVIIMFQLILLLSFSFTVQAASIPFLANTTDQSLIQEFLIIQEISRFNPRLSEATMNKICQAILKESKANDLDPLLVTGVIAAESSFRPHVVSPCAARGLMQISRVVGKMMKITDPFDIQQNIYAGTRYLKELQDRFKSKELMLAAYNAGPTRVARLGRIPHIRETINYVRKITLHHAKLQTSWSKSLACKINSNIHTSFNSQFALNMNKILNTNIGINVSLNTNQTQTIERNLEENIPPKPFAIPYNPALVVNYTYIPKPTV